MKRLLFLALLFSACMGAAAQTNYAFKTEFANKVIYVDSLGLPGNMSLESVLSNIPELMVRPGENLQDKYEVWVNGMAVGSSYEVAIAHLQLQDVDKIEITEMSRAAYEKMGGTGGLNIILKSSAPGIEGLNGSKGLKGLKGLNGSNGSRKWWGNATIGAGYATDIAPSGQVNYSTKRFSVKGIAFGEYANRNYESSVTGPTSLNTADNHSRLGKEFVGIYTHWQATDKDVFDFNAIQSYGYTQANKTSKDIVYGQLPSTTLNNDTAHATSLRFKTCYTHTFSDCVKLDFQGQLIYDISKKYQLIPTSFNSEDGTTGTFTGTLNATFRVFKNETGYGKITAGSDYNINRDNTDYGDTNNWPGEFVNANGKCVSLMPFVRWEQVYKKFQVQAEVDYLYFTYRMSGSKTAEYTYNNHNVGGYLALEQQVARNHHLRLYYERRVKRPKLSQFYAFELYYPAEQTKYKGNPSLLPTISDQINFDWIMRYNFGLHHLTVDLGVNYEHQSDVIKTISTIKSGTGSTIYSYDNSQSANIVGGNLMVFYRYNFFSCLFGGRVYHNSLREAGKEIFNNTYTNLSLTPAFALPNGWNASAYIAYYGRVRTSTLQKGDLGVVQVKIGKTIGHWDPCLFVSTCFTGNVKDITYNTSGSLENVYQLLPTTVGVGLRYNF